MLKNEVGGSMRRKPKLEIIYEFRKERAKLLESELTSKDKEKLAILNLSEIYLVNYPELNDPDCCGAGLPMYYVETLST